MKSGLIALAVAVALLGTTACAGKKKLKPEMRTNTGSDASMTGSGLNPNGKNGEEMPGDQILVPGNDRWKRTGDEVIDKYNPENPGGENTMDAAPIPELAAVYFSLDSDGLDTAATMQADKNAAYLNSRTGLMVSLHGHTDDSGTEEYNFALGSRRAQAVRDYLVDHGVNADRLQTVSFGETVPATEATDDSSRSLNRRVEFFVYTVEK